MIKKFLLPLLGSFLTFPAFAQYPQPGPMTEPSHWQTIVWIRSATLDHVNAFRMENGLSPLTHSSDAENLAQGIVEAVTPPPQTTPFGTNLTSLILHSRAFTTGLPLASTSPAFDIELSFPSTTISFHTLPTFSGLRPGEVAPENDPSWTQMGVGVVLWQNALYGHELLFSISTQYVSTPHQPTELERILPGAVSIGNGWHYSAWLGSLYTQEFPSVLIWGVGYAYIDTLMSNGYFLRYWDPRLGWLRTTLRHAYQGFYWSENETGWIYRSLSSTWPRIIYSYPRQTWDYVY